MSVCRGMSSEGEIIVTLGEVQSYENFPFTITARIVLVGFLIPNY